MSETTNEFSIADLMGGTLGDIPERKKAEAGRYEATLRTAKYDPDDEHKILLAFGDLRSVEDPAKDMRNYDNVLVSWSDKTPKVFLEDLFAFFRAHKAYRSTVDPKEMLPELVGKRYTFQIVQRKDKPEYTNVKNVRPIEG